MPEGHTIHRLARDMAGDLRGRPVRSVSRQDRFRAGAERLDGRVVEDASAAGKHLFLHWVGSAGQGPEVLHVHLGLVGKFARWELPAPEPSGALRVRLTGACTAWDLTGPMICDLRSPDVVDEVLARLGPDPLRADADPELFVRRVRRSPKAIGALLLDQAVIAGLGNVYRAEILHVNGIHPESEGRSLSEEQVWALWRTAVDELRLGFDRNRIVTVPLAGRELSAIERDESFHVYGQEQCRSCGEPVEVAEVGGRSSFACPVCQTR